RAVSQGADVERIAQRPRRDDAGSASGEGLGDLGAQQLLLLRLRDPQLTASGLTVEALAPPLPCDARDRHAAAFRIHDRTAAAQPLCAVAPSSSGMIFCSMSVTTSRVRCGGTGKATLLRPAASRSRRTAAICSAVPVSVVIRTISSVSTDASRSSR